MVDGQSTEDRGWTHGAGDASRPVSKALRSIIDERLREETTASVPALTPDEISAIDAAHVWHPYSTIGAEAQPPLVAVGARGAWLTLIQDGKRVEVLDAMSSWWTAIHGHGHPALDYAIASQLASMNHVMFGGLTHEPAARLAQLLVDIT